ncbi:MAG: IS701 family transposase, partial [Actinobacteria bacterium]|nr:IS701 family transposase [Actinomycetota bacterium]
MSGTARRIGWSGCSSGASWDADALRDAVRDYVVEHLGGPDGVLIADDTQVIKKGAESVGVAPQYCGATGQVENCQVMPMLTYASGRGHAFIDRALYLPECWTADPDRCAEAGVPADRDFATKPQLVIGMLECARAAGVPFGYFAADAGYGRDPALRTWCHTHQVPYVMAVPVDLPLLDARGRPTRPDRVLATLSPTVWERRSCGKGTKGERYYDWAAVAGTVKDQPPSHDYAHTLLVRRSVSTPIEIEFFLTHAPEPTPIPELVAVAGMRWKIEENNEQGKDLLGLNEYQVRKWTPGTGTSPPAYSPTPSSPSPAPTWEKTTRTRGPSLLRPPPLIRLSLA